MNLTVALSVIGAFGAFVGVFVGVVQARAAIREGRRQQADHDNQIESKGFNAGVASCQAQIFDLKNQVTQLTDDRNYWRGMNGGGRDSRRTTDDNR